MFKGIGSSLSELASSLGVKSWEAFKGCIVNSLGDNKPIFISCEGMNINFKSEFIGARTVKEMISALDTYNIAAKEFIKTPLGPLYKRQIISNKKISDLLKEYQSEFKNFKQTSFLVFNLANRLRKTTLRMSRLLKDIDTSCDKYKKFYTDEEIIKTLVDDVEKDKIPKYRWYHLMETISSCASLSISKIDNIILNGGVVNFKLLELTEKASTDAKLERSEKRRRVLNKNLEKGWDKIVLKSVEGILKNLKEACYCIEYINGFYKAIKDENLLENDAAINEFKNIYVGNSQKLIGSYSVISELNPYANNNGGKKILRPEYRKLFKHYWPKLLRTSLSAGEWSNVTPPGVTNSFSKMLQDLCMTKKSAETDANNSKEALKYELQSSRLLSKIKRLEKEAYDKFCSIQKTDTGKKSDK